MIYGRKEASVVVNSRGECGHRKELGPKQNETENEIHGGPRCSPKTDVDYI